MHPHEKALIDEIKEINGDPKGKCYYSAEALYHILGGKAAGYTPVRGANHWWITNSAGDILDPTSDQFDVPFVYSVGRGGGFLTKGPSQRAMALMKEISNGRTTNHVS